MDFGFGCYRNEGDDSRPSPTWTSLFVHVNLKVASVLCACFSYGGDDEYYDSPNFYGGGTGGGAFAGKLRSFPFVSLSCRLIRSVGQRRCVHEQVARFTDCV